MRIVVSTFLIAWFVFILIVTRIGQNDTECTGINVSSIQSVVSPFYRWWLCMRLYGSVRIW